MHPTIHQLRTIARILNKVTREVESSHSREMRQLKRAIDESAKLVADDALRLYRGTSMDSMDMDLVSAYAGHKNTLISLFERQDETIRVQFAKQFKEETGMFLEIR